MTAEQIRLCQATMERDRLEMEILWRAWNQVRESSSWAYEVGEIGGLTLFAARANHDNDIRYFLIRFDEGGSRVWSVEWAMRGREPKLKMFSGDYGAYHKEIRLLRLFVNEDEPLPSPK